MARLTEEDLVTGVDGHTVRVSVVRETPGGVYTEIESNLAAVTAGGGFANFGSVSIPGIQPGDRVHVVVHQVGNPMPIPRLHGYVEALDRVFASTGRRSHHVITF